MDQADSTECLSEQGARDGSWGRVIGILGGLGPYAHLELERLILEAASRRRGGAVRDQDYPEWIVSSVASAPDRSEAILRGSCICLSAFLLTITVFDGAGVGEAPRVERSASWSQTRVGPPAGKLLVCGGEDKKAMLSLFLQLVGEANAPIVVIPTASIHSRIEENPVVRELKSLGATHVTLLHTRDPKIANTEEFVQPLRRARGVWISGGRQWRLADAYLHTRAHRELFNLLDRGGIIGGSSAGASIQASYLVRGAPEGNSILMAPGHEEGFGFLRQTAIDQHVLARNRLGGLTNILEKHPDLLGIGIDEKTAIVVEGDQFEVAGAGKVAVYDATRPGWPEEKPYILLSAGERYDLKHRRRV